MQQEAVNIGISLDSKSVEIIKKVDKIHRDSLINIGLALVEQTNYYKTIAGIKEPKSLEDVASLDVNNEDSKKKEEKAATVEAPKKASTSWDAF